MLIFLNKYNKINKHCNLIFSLSRLYSDLTLNAHLTQLFQFNVILLNVILLTIIGRKSCPLKYFIKQCGNTRELRCRASLNIS